ncbi:MAG: hypothetical protein JWR52_1129 [Marmoricola sp.]|nr:hypothetical protein [Marmoricola sp.]
MSDIDVDPVTSQVVHQAQLISQLRQDLDRLASEVTDAYTDVIARLDDPHDPSGTTRAPAAWSWRTIGPHAADQLWAQLRGWVDWLRARYPLAKRIPRWWDEHPEFVEELTALWLAWQFAYEQSDPPMTAAADWHDRWLPGLLDRLEHGAFATNCSTEHHPRPPGCYSTSVVTQDSYGKYKTD